MSKLMREGYGEGLTTESGRAARTDDRMGDGNVVHRRDDDVERDSGVDAAGGPAPAADVPDMKATLMLSGDALAALLEEARKPPTAAQTLDEAPAMPRAEAVGAPPLPALHEPVERAAKKRPRRLTPRW